MFASLKIMYYFHGCVKLSYITSFYCPLSPAEFLLFVLAFNGSTRLTSFKSFVFNEIMPCYSGESSLHTYSSSDTHATCVSLLSNIDSSPILFHIFRVQQHCGSKHINRYKKFLFYEIILLHFTPLLNVWRKKARTTNTPSEEHFAEIFDFSLSLCSTLFSPSS